MPSGAHFVLVHGASHGAWCWYKIRCLLESAGQKVTCLDLRASGIDPYDANTVFKFEEYNQPLDDAFSGLSEGEKVILVGHSAGGLNLLASLYKYPEKIQVAVYVVGQMIRNTPKVPPVYPIDKDEYDVYYGEGPHQPPTSCVYKKELVRNHFYQRSPLEDVTLAEMLLRPVPIRALWDATFPDDHGKEIDEVPRVYIKTLDDNAISQEGQDALINKWPPAAVYTIDSDHSPFFSNPFELFALLLKVATNYGSQYKSWEDHPSSTVMDGFSSCGSPATKIKFRTPNCGRLSVGEYGVSTYEKNILKSCHACSSCGGFPFWAEEEEGKGSKGSQHNPFDDVRIKQSGGCCGDDILIDLKDQMISMVHDAGQMRIKMKGMSDRNFDASRVVTVLCLSIFLIFVTVMALKNWGNRIGAFGFLRDVFWL